VHSFKTNVAIFSLPTLWEVNYIVDDSAWNIQEATLTLQE
jgi:hypothetical protein